MKRRIVLGVVLMLAVAPLAIAQMDPPAPDVGAGQGMGMGMGQGMMKGAMMEKGGMMGGKMQMMHGMMGKMMDKSVVATSDGGIVIVSANKITKYDQELNVVKEVELKMMTMEEMQKMCPMMGKGMMGDMGGDAPIQQAVETSQPAAIAPVPVQDSGHEAHH